MNKFCESCGMPMTQKEHFAKGDENSKFCLYCVNEDGSVKTCEEIFEGGVQFFMNHVGQDRKLAEKITRKNMRMQTYWQGGNCSVLEGETATDQEFAEVLKKLG